MDRNMKYVSYDENLMIANAGERDDLKSLLMATLKRLEAVDRVVQRADQMNVSMEAQVASLEQERNRASDAAVVAQAQVEALLKSQRRVDWQNKVYFVCSLF